MLNPSLEEKDPAAVTVEKGDLTSARRKGRRTPHHKHGQRGRIAVLLMIVLVLAHWGLRGYLFSIGQVHPLTVAWNMPTQTAILTNGFLTALGLLCLFLLYRGNVSMRSVFGTVSAIAAAFYAIVFGWGLLAELPAMWIGFNALALAASGFAAWCCLLSKTSARFLAYQEDKR